MNSSKIFNINWKNPCSSCLNTHKRQHCFDHSGLVAGKADHNSVMRFLSFPRAPLWLLAIVMYIHFTNEATAANVQKRDVSLLEIEQEVEDLREQIAEQEKLVNLLRGNDCPADSPICMQKRASYAQKLHRKQVNIYSAPEMGHFQ